MSNQPTNITPSAIDHTGWSLRFDRDGSEDIAVIYDGDDDEIVRSQPFWLPEGSDPVPPTLAALRLMAVAPQLFHHLGYFLDFALRKNAGEDEAVSRRIEDARNSLSGATGDIRTRYTVTAWCNRPFFAQCDVEAGDPEEAIAKARKAVLEAPAEECNQDYSWDEWRVDSEDTDAVLVRLEGESRLKAAAPKLLEACRRVVERWEGRGLAEAARMCHAAAKAATDDPAGPREPIVIELRGGCVVDVRNLPQGCDYLIQDHDDVEDAPDDISGPDGEVRP